MPGPVNLTQTAELSPVALNILQPSSVLGNNIDVAQVPTDQDLDAEVLDLSTEEPDSSEDTCLDETVIENPVSCSQARVILRKKKKGRPTKAETLEFNPEVPNLINYVLSTRVTKRSRDTQVKCSVPAKKSKIKPKKKIASKSNSEVKPKLEERESLDQYQIFSTISPGKACTRLSLAMAGGEADDMSKVLATLNRMEGNLSTIRTDIKKVSDDSTELKSLYSSLKQQIQDSETKQDEKFDLINERLSVLEEQYKLHPANLNADEIRQVINQQVVTRVTEVMSSTLDNPLVASGEELAVKVNKALEALDANERSARRLKVVITGLTPEMLKSAETVRDFLSTKCNAEVPVTVIETVTQPPLAIVTLPSWESKQQLLKVKGKALAGTRSPLIQP